MTRAMETTLELQRAPGSITPEGSHLGPTI